MLSRGAVTSLMLHGGLLATLLLADPGEVTAPMPQMLPAITVSLVAAPAPAAAPAAAQPAQPAPPAAHIEPVTAPAEPPPPEPTPVEQVAEPEPLPLPLPKPPLPQPVMKPKPQVVKQPAPAKPSPSPKVAEAAAQPATQAVTDSAPLAVAMAAPSIASGPVALSAAAPAATIASDEPPVLHHARFRRPPTPPAYPPRARTLEQEGVSVIRALIDPDGVSREVRLWRSSGHQLLDQAALSAVRGWAFEAARLGDRPVLAWVEIPVRFEIR